jgi:hypothetical protein
MLTPPEAGHSAAPTRGAGSRTLRPRPRPTRRGGVRSTDGDGPIVARQAKPDGTHRPPRGCVGARRSTVPSE